MLTSDTISPLHDVNSGNDLIYFFREIRRQNRKSRNALPWFSDLLKESVTFSQILIC